jgi:hypothetical protein
MADPAGGRVDAAWVFRMGVWGARSLALVLVLALLFTMVNVQLFAASGHPVGSVQWWIAWLLDPMASITMGTAIVFEGSLAGYGRRVGWLAATKWYAGGCTWVMNIWVSVTSGSLAGVLLHSVAPGLVLLLAEAAPRVRAQMAEIVEELVERDDTRSPVDGALPVPTAAVLVGESVVARPTWVAPPRSPARVQSPIVTPDPQLAPVVEDSGVPELAVKQPIAEAPIPEPVLVGVVPFPVEVPAAGEPTTEDELDVAVRRLLDDALTAGVRAPGRRALAKVLGPWATPDRIRRSLQRVGEPTRVLALNGSGPGAGPQRVTGAGAGDGDRHVNGWGHRART